jgi:curved DNA-binding protein CbpA
MLMSDPFTVLGVGEEVGDDEVKHRYLALVRTFPPDRDPERFQLYRAAYEALSDERKRLEVKLLQTNSAAVSRMKLLCLEPAAASFRATKKTVAALLTDGISRERDGPGYAGKGSGKTVGR